ncbi:MAG: hypothetical protein KH366_13295 [Clostridiaceae bacterium]|nr:hypothetical protein [Clostridiaceae bacterium]
MSALKAFLQPPVAGKTKEVIISERFTDEGGNIIPFVIQAISQEENEALAKKSRIEKTVDDIPVETLDNIVYTKRLMLACVKEPDLRDAELCKYYGVVDPLEVLGKMLSVGEYRTLSEAVLQINGMKNKKEKLKEAKNS